MRKEYDWWYPANLIDLKRFFKSKCMAEYLEDKMITYYELPQIIACSAVSVDDKMQALRDLMAIAKEFSKTELYDRCEEYLNSLIEAMNLLDAPGVFVAYYSSYYESYVDEVDFLQGVYGTYEEVKDFVCQSYDAQFGAGTSKHFNYYHRAHKFVRDEKGKYTEVCTYYFVNKELVYVELEHDMDTSMLYGHDLNLPVPFKAGDIVEIDNIPFSGKYRVIILGIGDNKDCCSVQAMYKGFDGKWDKGAFKHASLKFFTWRVHQISPLLSGEIYTGELIEEDEKLFPEIQEYIRKNYPDGDTLMKDSYHIYCHICDDILKPKGEKWV